MPLLLNSKLEGVRCLGGIYGDFKVAGKTAVGCYDRRDGRQEEEEDRRVDDDWEGSGTWHWAGLVVVVGGVGSVGGGVCLFSSRLASCLVCKGVIDSRRDRFAGMLFGALYVLGGGGHSGGDFLKGVSDAPKFWTRFFF